MFRPLDQADAPANKKIKTGVADLFATGEVSGQAIGKIFGLLGDMELTGVIRGFEAMGQKKHDHKNAKRDLERKLLKGSAWPKPYEMKLPVWSLAQQQEVFFLLFFWGGGLGGVGGSCIMSGNFI